MNCACKEWHRNGNRFRCYFGIKQGCRPAKIFANATAPSFMLSGQKYLFSFCSKADKIIRLAMWLYTE